MNRSTIRALWHGSTDPFRSPLLAKLFGYTNAQAFNRAVTPPDVAELNQAWELELAKKANRQQRADTIGRAYDGANARSIRIEQKAVGLLQVVAIGFAIIAIVADRDSPILVALAVVAIAHLALATIGSFELLKAEGRLQVVSHHATNDSAGLKDTAVAASWLEARSTIASNFLAGVLRDLKIGLFAAIVALILSVIGVGDNSATASLVRSESARPTAPTTAKSPSREPTTTPQSSTISQSSTTSESPPESPAPDAPTRRTTTEPRSAPVAETLPESP